MLLQYQTRTVKMYDFQLRRNRTQKLNSYRLVIANEVAIRAPLVTGNEHHYAAQKV